MSWLPPKSLLQLQCVRNSWYALIGALVKSSWFVAKHLKNSERNSSLFRKSCVSYCFPPRREAMNLFLIFNKGEDNSDQIHFNIEEFNLPESIAGPYGSHCNGILCLPDRDTNTVLLCNPAIREFKLLQSSCFGCNFKIHMMAGLGYDAIANVYKVIRVLRLHSSDDGAPIGAEICTLDSNHSDSRRENKMKIEIDMTSLTFDAVYHRGVCYWVIIDKFLYKMLISSDMHEEEFHTIPFLVDHDQQEFRATSSGTIINWKLGLCGERGALFRHVGSMVPRPLNSNPMRIGMWILDEFSGRCHKQSFCWTKFADLFFPGIPYIVPILLWKSNELLLFTSDDGPIVSYNLHTQKLRNVQLNSHNRTFVAFVYVESLVSIDGARKMMNLS